MNNLHVPCAAPNPLAGQLVPCTPALCPYANWTNASSTSLPQLVNRAPYMGYTSALGFINPHGLPIYKAAVYQVYALVASQFSQMVREQLPLPRPAWQQAHGRQWHPSHSAPAVGTGGTQIVLNPGPISPFRYSHLNANASSLAAWGRQGYNLSDVHRYLPAVQASADHPNMAMEVRITSTNEFRCACCLGLRSQPPVGLDPPTPRRPDSSRLRLRLPLRVAGRCWPAASTCSPTGWTWLWCSATSPAASGASSPKCPSRK